MLSQADANLVARDYRLPGLKCLLDPQAFRDMLDRALPDLCLDAVEIGYVRYKPGTNCLSAFTLEVAGRSVRGYAKAYRTDDWDKLHKADERSIVAGPLGPGRFIIEEYAIEVVFFPNDNKLRTLRKLFDDTSGPKLLARTFPDRPDLQAGTVHHLRYKPERRFVARLDTDGEPQAVLKLYSHSAYAAAQRAVETFDRSISVVGQSDRHCMLAFAWRAGTQLADSISGPDLCLADVAQTGSALAVLHDRDGGTLAVRDREAEVTTILATAENLAVLHPPLLRLTGELVRRFANELAQAPAIQQPIHGDFYAQQVLVGADRIEILDLDEAVIADPAADLGLFIAHLERDALCGQLPEARVAPVRDALLAGYGLPPERVDLYTAIGLLQLAPHHFRHREPDWSARMEATLERALSIVCQRHAICV